MKRLIIFLLITTLSGINYSQNNVKSAHWKKSGFLQTHEQPLDSQKVNVSIFIQAGAVVDGRWAYTDLSGQAVLNNNLLTVNKFYGGSFSEEDAPSFSEWDF